MWSSELEMSSSVGKVRRRAVYRACASFQAVCGRVGVSGLVCFMWYGKREVSLTVFVGGGFLACMVVRTRTQDEIRIQSEGGHPMRVVFERVQWFSLFRIPYSDCSIAAGGIKHVSPTPFNDVHAGGVSAQSELHASS